MDRLITQLEITTSTVASGSGTASIRPLKNAAFDAPARTARALEALSALLAAVPQG